MKKSIFLFSILMPFLFASGALSDEPKQNIPAFSEDKSKTYLNNLMLQAQQGDADSQSMLGSMYFGGQGIPPDNKLAFKWFTLAAKQGQIISQYNLGVMYDNGWGVPQDYKLAFKWYTLAAQQGQNNAQYNLGVLYANGKGVLQDYIWAHMWFNIAGSNSNGSAPTARNDIALFMSAADIAKAQKLARECMESNYTAC